MHTTQFSYYSKTGAMERGHTIEAIDFSGEHSHSLYSPRLLTWWYYFLVLSCSHIVLLPTSCHLHTFIYHEIYKRIKFLQYLPSFNFNDNFLSVSFGVFLLKRVNFVYGVLSMSSRIPPNTICGLPHAPALVGIIFKLKGYK